MSASGSRTVKIKIVGENNAKSVFGEVEKDAGGLSGTLGEVGKIAGGFVVAQGLTKLPGLFSDTVGAGSDLQESLNAVNQIFGDNAGDILNWGENTANSFGLSQRAFNDLVVPLGAGLKNAGLDMDDVTGTTLDLTERAADMASVFNTDVDEALAAIQAGLRGEADPLERFGVGLSAAAVEAEALAMTGKTVADELTNEEKALARVNLIMRQTEDVAGDFTNTSDGAANAARIAAARQEELAAAIGTKLLPVQQAITNAKLKFMELIANKVIPAVSRLIDTFGEFMPKVQPIVGFIQDNIRPIMAGLAAVLLTVVVPAFVSWAVSAGTAAVATLVALAPVIAVVTAVGVAVALLYKAWESNFLGIQDIVQAVIDFVRPYIETAIQGIQDFFETAWPIISGALQTAWDVIQTVVTTAIDIIKPMVATWLEGVQTAFETVWPIVQKAVELAWDGIQTAVDTITTIKETIERVLGEIKTVWDTIWGEIKDAASFLWNGVTGIYQTIKGAVEEVKSTIDTVIGEVRDLWGEIWDEVFDKLDTVWNGVTGIIATVSTAIGEVKTFFTDLPGDILEAIGDVTELLLDVGSDIMTGLWDGLKGKWDEVTGWFGDITDSIPDLKGPPERDRKLLYNSGQLIMGGFQDGLIEAWDRTRPELKRITDEVKSSVDTAFEDFQLATGASGHWKEIFDKYIKGVVERGDSQNDWLTHLPKPWRDQALAIGKAIKEEVHGSGGSTATSGVNVSVGDAGSGTTKPALEAIDYDRMAEAVVRGLRESDAGKPVILQIGTERIAELIIRLFNEHAEVVYG